MAENQKESYSSPVNQSLKNSRMEYSTWRIWLHPRATKSVLSDYEETITNLRSEAEKMQAEMTRLHQEKDACEAESLSLKGDNDKLRQELSATKLKLRKADAELADRKEAEAKIAEFESVLSRVEDMKRRYEQRISNLRHIVHDMKRASGEPDPEAMELKEIKLDAGNGDDDRRNKQSESDKSDSDWLEELPGQI